jgi:hypothetical protein
MKKIGTVPLANPELLQTLKTGEDGRAQLKVSELATKGSGKASKGNSSDWICVILQTRDPQGNSTKIVSVPLHLHR